MRRPLTLNDGDNVEQVNKAWIRNRLPGYEVLWRSFIGNDGYNRSIPLKNLGRISDADRERFAQAHYSLLLAILALRDIAMEFEVHKAEVLTDEQYRRVHRDLICFMAHLGRLRDMAEKMDTALKASGKLSRRFDDFYSQRNNVLHSPVPAQRVDSNYLQIAIPAKRTHLSKTWAASSMWSDAAHLSFVELDRFVLDTTEEAIALTRGAISDSKEMIEKVIGFPLQPILIETEISNCASMEGANNSGISFSAGSSVFRIDDSTL